MERRIINNDNNRNSNHMGRDDLLRRIQELAFMKVECELYLDAYPECNMALEQYKNIIKQYTELAERYENEYGTIRQENTRGGEWKWVSTPWPWQLDGNGKER